MNTNYEQKITALENQIEDLQEQLSKFTPDKIREIVMSSIHDIFLKVSTQNR
jgi:DNA repair photolyase